MAIIYVKAGYDAKALERVVRGSAFTPSPNPPQPIVIDLVTDDSDDDAELGESSKVGTISNAPAVVQDIGDPPVEESGTAAVDVSVSPALSYLTLEEQRSEHGDPSDLEVGADRAEGEARQGTMSPYSRLCALPSSDQESGEDDRYVPRSSRPAGFLVPQDDATERLLHGEITAVRTFVQGASLDQRQHMRLLSGHASSAGPSDRPLRQEDSDSDSELSTKGQSDVRRYEQNALRHPLRTRKGTSKDLSGAAVPKPFSHRAIPNDRPDDRGSVSVTLPKAEHAKGRRLMVPVGPSLPIAAVYMRGDIQFVHQGTRCVYISVSRATPLTRSHRQGAHRPLLAAR